MTIYAVYRCDPDLGGLEDAPCAYFSTRERAQQFIDHMTPAGFIPQHKFTSLMVDDWRVRTTYNMYVFPDGRIEALSPTIEYLDSHSHRRSATGSLTGVVGSSSSSAEDAVQVAKERIRNLQAELDRESYRRQHPLDLLAALGWAEKPTFQDGDGV